VRSVECAAPPSLAAMVRAIGLDHIVLRTPDVERALRWWVEALGLEGDRVEAWRAGEVPFPSVRLDATTIIDLFAGERTGTNLDHVCVVIEPTDLDVLATSGDFDVQHGPVEVYGAQGVGRSVYVRDPDGNVVELRCYPG
jgi:catechol 2,3-dioxygenase-like lactoylglutathione lyase family enzyme